MTLALSTPAPPQRLPSPSETRGDRGSDLGSHRLSFEDYLAYHDGTDTRYELVDGKLHPMSLGTGRHGAAINRLNTTLRAEIQRFSQPWIALALMVGVQTRRADGRDRSRIPDLVVLPTAQWQAMGDREAVIRIEEPPPLLVVEVVSPSTQREDYRAKRTEYAAIDIPEYWILDPLAEKLTILTLDEGWYDPLELAGNQGIVSPTFGELNMAIEDLLRV